MWKELGLPELASWSLKWNSTIHVNQRARLLNEVKTNRETCKNAEKRACTILYGNTKRKRIDMYFKNRMTNVFLREFSGVNPVVINYKIRHNKNWPAMRPARSSLVWPDRFLLLVVAEKQKTRFGHTRLHARVTIEEGLLSVWVSQSIG